MSFVYEFEVRQKLVIDGNTLRDVNTVEKARELLEQGFGQTMGYEPELVLVHVGGGE